ncbi:UDP-N-acetylmuramoyl-L-alanine--D-glutamate ligase [Brevundimonas goettingensis]|uniref:UDP-N-acetylmuramoylalanine--D-glutamate ligase n=1 Tax=Brevundimonas goettingensis TaxID=2774190 RepID=A0A975GV05_9CAUL|nr:UDP-N-acetylmuramoyl-L-alanine--D-glutamate ligase [Brevundimonas goettingensis]QTC90053.1 UDP-N-acetylmuramoyl-L-alanine--D-glutamate ligase [Brevundimonas goettingensis]
MIAVPGFENRRVAVFGLGRSGITAARALHAGGAIPILWDDGVSGRMQAEAEGFTVEDLTTADWSRFAALILSPGAPLTHPKPHWTVEKAKAAWVPVMGDIELFARALATTPDAVRPKVVAITGTNGKSTTTALTGWVLKQAGLKVAVGGNIGIGVLALPAPAEVEVYVIEVSSYQLDLTTSFSPDVAILTNVTPDHLDRHGGMEGYVGAKRRLFQTQTPDKLALVGVDDDWGWEVVGDLNSRRLRVSTITTRTPGERRESVAIGDLAAERPDQVPAFDEGRFIIVDATDGHLTVDGVFVTELAAARSLPGRHNAQNAAFAYAAARAVGVSNDAAVAGLMSFPGLAHRMETVGQISDQTGQSGTIKFVNDSKATNADAARQALTSYPAVFWIAGGKAKDGGIDDLSDLFGVITKAYLIGEAADAFAKTLGDVPHVISKTLDVAVAQAAEDAKAAGGDQIVLLSPACASFDQYPDFEARGEAFRAAALNLGATPLVHG